MAQSLSALYPSHTDEKRWLEIESIVNEAVGIDSREKVTAGQIVKGIIINGLDFISKPLYLFPQFFANKPVEELLG
ncbi:MAG: DUF4277 domain-containing protein [Microcystis aeruginosa W13-11]|nr:DUF4277 domain-containing protein [Microcystis aeruginosa W13-11]